MNVIIKIHRTLKTRGTYGTLKWICNGYLSFKKFLVFYTNLQNPFDFNNEDSALRIKKATLEEFKNLRDKKEKLPFEFYCDLTHHFTMPFVAFVNDQLAAICWLVYPGETSRFLNIKEGDVEINYNTVLPEFRGLRLAEKLMAYIIDDCKNSKFKRMFGVVSADNIPQYKPMLRLGFEPVECLTHFGFYRPHATLRYVK